MKYSVIISLLFVVLLPACSHNPQRADYSVDHYNLVRSAVYTQRELINTQLTVPASQTAALHAQKQAMLLASYCDLIVRRTIFASAPAGACTEQSPEIRQCISEFHRCFRTCELRGQDCVRCEQPAMECIDKSET